MSLISYSALNIIVPNRTLVKGVHRKDTKNRPQVFPTGGVSISCPKACIRSQFSDSDNDNMAVIETFVQTTSQILTDVASSIELMVFIKSFYEFIKPFKEIKEQVSLKPFTNTIEAFKLPNALDINHNFKISTHLPTKKD